MLNFYRRFIPRAARALTPLTTLLKGPKNNAVIAWTTETSQSFEEAKAILSNATLLAHPRAAALLVIFVDASDTGIGAVLQEYDDETWLPLTFFSQKLNKAQSQYSTYDRELLAAYSAIKRFRHNVEGRQFTLYTDHKPLIYAFQQKPERATPRQFRHLDFISQFTTDIRHVTGEDNIVTDALSRISSVQSVTPITHQQLASEQGADPELQELLTTSTNLQMDRLHFPNEDVHVYCSMQGGRTRPYVPQFLRRNILHSCTTYHIQESMQQSTW